MERKMIMQRKDGKIWTYLSEDGAIAEIHCYTDAEEAEQTEVVPRIGDIYVGRVKNIVQNIGAAFVEIANGVPCYYDLSQAKHAVFTKKMSKKPLCIGEELLVQVTREAVKTKVATVSSNISFTGRYAILTTGNTRIGVSGKLPRSLRDEIKERLQEFQNDEFGLIVRTNAKEVPFETVRQEIETLREEYKRIQSIAGTRTCFSCLKSAPSPYITDIQNVYAEGLEEIITDDEELYTSIRDFLSEKQPEYLQKLRFYEDRLLPMSKLYSTESALRKALSEKVWLKHGGYLIIQYTEALTVIDVNSGKNISKRSPEEGYLKLNLEAAEEIARQLRLRNLSGIILVDFVNLEEEEHMQLLLRTMRKFLNADPIPATLVDVTGLQLVEITRKKGKKPLHESVGRKYFYEQKGIEDECDAHTGSDEFKDIVL